MVSAGLRRLATPGTEYPGSGFPPVSYPDDSAFPPVHVYVVVVTFWGYCLANWPAGWVLSAGAYLDSGREGQPLAFASFGFSALAQVDPGVIGGAKLRLGGSL